MLNNQFIRQISAEELWHLSREAVDNPQKIIQQFFDSYGLGGSHEHLWEMLKGTLSSVVFNDWNEIRRANIVTFYELTTQLLQANYVLFLKMKEPPKKR